MSILDPRLWIAALLALAAAFGGGYFKGERHGRKAEQLVHAAAVAAANEDARRLENARQSRADEAAAIAARREAGIRAAADRARSERDGLQHDLGAALDYAAESHAASQQVARAAAGVVETCSRILVEVSEYADRADAEARELRQGWPD